MARLAISCLGVLACAGSIAAPTSGAPAAVPAIIDMHLHAEHVDAEGPPPVAICAPYGDPRLGTGWPIRDAATSGERYGEDFLKRPPCARPLWSPKDDDALRDDSLRVLERRNIVAVASGPADVVARWRAQAPQRIIPALAFSAKDGPAPDALRALVKSGAVAVIGEMLGQYDGIAPADPANEPYFALAEELDVPVAIHVGPGPPGIAYFTPATAGYRAKQIDPLSLEDVLLRHPRLRLYLMHAGWPKLDDTLALLYAHPQVYVDTGVIDYVLPHAEFYRYLKTIVDAGFAERVMFGSDQMVWPQAIEAAIATIEQAPFLSAKQKRDILHDNAARFLRLKQ